MQRETPVASEAVQNTPPQAPETERPSVTILPTNRVEALADGIVAIATTLLVLEIKQPLVQSGLDGQCRWNCGSRVPRRRSWKPATLMRSGG